MPTAYAYLRITSENLPLAAITALLEIQPTDCWEHGSPGKYNKRREFSAWCLASPLPKTITDLHQHVEALLDVLKPKLDAIRMLSQSYQIYLVCVGNYDETASPGLFLSRETIATIAAMGAAVDADLYFGKA